MTEQDHFERLGLPRRFALAADELEQLYLQKSREVHPDLAGDTPESLQAASRLNEAYAVLKDPFRRANYLHQLAGGPSANEVKQPPADFLEEMLDLRMQVEEAKMDADVRRQLDADLKSRRQAMLDRVGAELDGESPDLVSLRQQLNALKYVQGLIRDLSED